MKNRAVFLILFSIFFMRANAQFMSLGFIKNCSSYKKTTFEDELTKKHFFLVQKPATVSSPLLAEAVAYSNEKKENAGTAGEIKVLSLINEKLNLTEITFFNGSKNYWKNYNEIFKQMVNFFNNQQSFKSLKYKTDVALFSKDNIFYYAYKNGEIPVIVISNVKLENTYFSN